MLSNAVPKLKPGERTRAERKQQTRAEETAVMRSCYRIVDERDGSRCRVCKAHGNPRATTLLERLHHHHVIFRSRGGQHEAQQVILLCSHCHDEIHVKGTLYVSGDADLRDAVTGRLCGIQVERLTESGWKTERFC